MRRKIKIESGEKIIEIEKEAAIEEKGQSRVSLFCKWLSEDGNNEKRHVSIPKLRKIPLRIREEIGRRDRLALQMRYMKGGVVIWNFILASGECDTWHLVSGNWPGQLSFQICLLPFSVLM